MITILIEIIATKERIRRALKLILTALILIALEFEGILIILILGILILILLRLILLVLEWIPLDLKLVGLIKVLLILALHILG